MNNFHFINVQREYYTLLDEKCAGDSEVQKTYNYAEIVDSDLEQRIDEIGQTSYEISLLETEFTKKSTSSSEINSDDFILKVTSASDSMSSPTFIRIPVQQMVLEKQRKKTNTTKRTVKRMSAGQDSPQNLRNLHKNIRRTVL